MQALDQGRLMGEAPGEDEAAHLGDLLDQAWALRLDDEQRALQMGRQAQRLAESLGDERAEARAQLVVGLALGRLRGPAQALDILQRALGTFERLGDQANQARAMLGIAICRHVQAHVREGREYAAAALAIQERIGDRLGAVETLQHLGAMYSEGGNYPESLDHFFRALRIVREVGHTLSEMRCSFNIGCVYSMIGEHNKALQYLGRGLDLAQASDHQHFQAAFLSALGDVHKDLGHHEQAIDYAERSLSVAPDRLTKLDRAENYTTLAEAHVSLGHLDCAEDYCRRAVVLGRDIEDSITKAYAQLALARVALARGEHQLAIEQLDEILSLAQAAENWRLEWLAQELLASAHERQAEFREALQYHVAASAVRERVLNQEVNARLRVLELDYETARIEREREMAVLQREQAEARANQAHEALARAQTLNEMAHIISSGLELGEILPNVVRLTVELLQADEATLDLYAGPHGRVTYRRPSEEGAVADTDTDGIEIACGAGAPPTPTAAGNELYDGGAVRPAIRGDEAGIDGRALRVPIISGHRELGELLVGRWPEHPPFDERDTVLAESLGRQAGVAIENARLYGQVRQLAMEDPLTGLYNRRYFFQVAGREIARGRRHGYPISALMVDIDDFKQFNDRYGHRIGDRVLRAVAEQCLSVMRQTDTLARYGGEEFVALLPLTDLDQATRAAERLHAAVAQATVRSREETLSVTVSIGVACTDAPSIDTLDQLLQAADRALYDAKEAGRDRIVKSSA